MQSQKTILNMMTSSNGNIFRVTAPLWVESTCHQRIPPQRPVTRSFDVFFDLRLNKRLGKQSRRLWFETPSCSLWRHCNGRKPKHYVTDQWKSFRVCRLVVAAGATALTPSHFPSNARKSFWDPADEIYGYPISSWVVMTWLNTLKPRWKWPPFSKQYIQIHFPEWKCLNSD